MPPRVNAPADGIENKVPTPPALGNIKHFHSSFAICHLPISLHSAAAPTDSRLASVRSPDRPLIISLPIVA
jgi:hypothetical protein